MKKWFLSLPVLVSCLLYSASADAGSCCGSYQRPSNFRESQPYMPGCCSAPSYSASSCDPCIYVPRYESQCSVEFGGEFLYRKFCLDEFNWAFTRTEVNSETQDVIDVSYETLCLDYEPGVRAWLGIQPCGSDSLGIYLGYVYLSGCGDDAIQQGTDNTVGTTIMHMELLQTAGGFTDIAVDWNNYYQEGEVVLGSDISCGKDHHFRPFFGAAGIYLEQKFELDLTDPEVAFNGDTGTVDWKSEYWGVGLRFGSHYKYQFNDCLSFIGRFNASLLVGENKYHNNQSVILATEADFEEQINYSGKSKCHFVPGYSVGVGFAIEPELCGCSLSMRVGYEFSEWHNIPNHRTFSGDASDIEEVAHSDSASTRTWGSHGLFAGLSFGF